MTIRKRNEKLVPFDSAKVRQTIERACMGLDGCSTSALELALHSQLRDGMSSQELMRTLIQVAVEKTSVEEPNWQYAAAQLLLVDCYKEAARNRRHLRSGYGEFYALIVHLEQIGRYGKYIREQYTKAEIDELAQYIQPERDLLLNYVGLKQLIDRYVIKGENGEILELPQELFLGVAMHLAMNELDKVKRAKQF